MNSAQADAAPSPLPQADMEVSEQAEGSEQTGPELATTAQLAKKFAPPASWEEPVAPSPPAEQGGTESDLPPTTGDCPAESSTPAAPSEQPGPNPPSPVISDGVESVGLDLDYEELWRKQDELESDSTSAESDDDACSVKSASSLVVQLIEPELVCQFTFFRIFQFFLQLEFIDKLEFFGKVFNKHLRGDLFIFGIQRAGRTVFQNKIDAFHTASEVQAESEREQACVRHEAHVALTE